MLVGSCVGWFPSLARLARYVGQKPSQWTKFPTVLAERKLFLRSAYLKHWKDQGVGGKIEDGHRLDYTYTLGNTPQTSGVQKWSGNRWKKVEKRIYDFIFPTTVDGRDPIPLFTRFYTSWVVQESFHQQYLVQFSLYQKKQKLLVAPMSSGKRWSCLPLGHVAETNFWVAKEISCKKIRANKWHFRYLA